MLLVFNAELGGKSQQFNPVSICGETSYSKQHPTIEDIISIKGLVNQQSSMEMAWGVKRLKYV